MVISRETAGGTTMLVSIPVPAKKEVPLARAAG
jgi:hypothetical protein